MNIAIAVPLTPRRGDDSEHTKRGPLVPVVVSGRQSLQRAQPPEPRVNGVVLLGRDDNDRPHAAWFAAETEPAAFAAAAAMGMATLTVAGETVGQLAGQLPQGKLFGSGRAFVPFVKAELFDQLVAQLPDGALDAAKAAAPETAVEGVVSKTALKFNPATLVKPKDWPSIKPGALVLATEGDQEGWYEAAVLDALPNGVFTLRWRDWPEEPTFVKHYTHMALLYPGPADAEPAKS